MLENNQNHNFINVKSNCSTYGFNIINSNDIFQASEVSKSNIFAPYHFQYRNFLKRREKYIEKSVVPFLTIELQLINVKDNITDEFISFDESRQIIPDLINNISNDDILLCTSNGEIIREICPQWKPKYGVSNLLLFFDRKLSKPSVDIHYECKHLRDPIFAVEKPVSSVIQSLQSNSCIILDSTTLVEGKTSHIDLSDNNSTSVLVDKTAVTLNSSSSSDFSHLRKRELECDTFQTELIAPANKCVRTNDCIHDNDSTLKPSTSSTNQFTENLTNFNSHTHCSIDTLEKSVIDELANRILKSVLTAICGVRVKTLYRKVEEYFENNHKGNEVLIQKLRDKNYQTIFMKNLQDSLFLIDSKTSESLVKVINAFNHEIYINVKYVRNIRKQCFEKNITHIRCAYSNEDLAANNNNNDSGDSYSLSEIFDEHSTEHINDDSHHDKNIYVNTDKTNDKVSVAVDKTSYNNSCRSGINIHNIVSNNSIATPPLPEQFNIISSSSPLDSKEICTLLPTQSADITCSVTEKTVVITNRSSDHNINTSLTSSSASSATYTTKKNESINYFSKLSLHDEWRNQIYKAIEANPPHLKVTQLYTVFAPKPKGVSKATKIEAVINSDPLNRFVINAKPNTESQHFTVTLRPPEVLSTSNILPPSIDKTSSSLTNANDVLDINTNKHSSQITITNAAVTKQKSIIELQEEWRRSIYHAIHTRPPTLSINQLYTLYAPKPIGLPKNMKIEDVIENDRHTRFRINVIPNTESQHYTVSIRPQEINSLLSIYTSLINRKNLN